MSKMRVVALGGGKGGVGESFVAVNLAVSLAKAGKRVVMVDADFGGANLHALFGVLQPPSTVADFVAGRAKTLAEVAIETQVPGLSILAGTCDVLGSVEHAGKQKRALLRGLSTLDADVLVIDVGAGTSVHTIDLFNAAETKLLVMTPELTSVQNAYGFLKVAVYRQLARVVAGSKAEARLTEVLGPDAFEIGSTMQKIDTFISLVSGEAPELERPFRLMLREMNVKLVGNMLASDQDRNTIWAVKRMIEKFLAVESDVAAAFRSNSSVRRSVNSGTPLTARRDASGYDVAEFERLARVVGDEDLQPLRALRSEIVQAVEDADAVIGLGLEDIEIAIDVEKNPVHLEDSRVTDPPVRVSEGPVLSSLRQAPAPGLLREAPAPVISVAQPPAAMNAAPARVVTPPPPPMAAMVTAPPPSVTSSGRPRPLPAAAAHDTPPVPRQKFVSELDRLRRRDSRGEVYVEVELAGCWFFGKLVSVDDQVVVRGIHPFGEMGGRTTRMRLVHMAGDDPSLTTPTEVVWRSYDASSSRAELDVTDPSAIARLSDHFHSVRRRRAHAA